MSQRRKAESDDDLLPEYDFSGAVRGKYYERYRQGTNVVLLDPDIAAVFHDSAAVNHTLRLLVSLAKAKAAGRKPTGRRPRSPNKPVQPTSPGTRGARRRKRAGAARD
jgi:hypothetical protein